MLLGIQVSTAGKIYEALERAHNLGCNTMQIFSRNPKAWRASSLEPKDIEEFQKRKAKYKIRPIFVHIPYLINLASPNPKLYEASIEAYIEDILEADLLKADYIVTHMGSHKETSEKEGLARLTHALNTILDATDHTKVGILLENTSGSGSWLGYKFIHHRIVIEGLTHKNKKRIGLCLDTAHLYSAGYNIVTKEGLDKTLQELDKLVGLHLLKLIHLNDSKDKISSRRDRHENIGKGKIGIEAIGRIINHPKLKNIPLILETPKKNPNDDKINLTIVRKLYRGQNDL